MEDMYNITSIYIMPSFVVEDGGDRRDCVAYLHEQLDINESELAYIRSDVLYTTCGHIRTLRKEPKDAERIKPHLDELKSQLEILIESEKEEEKERNKSPGAGRLDTGRNTEKLKVFFLTMFFNFFVFYEKKWYSLPDDEKKKKDYFRYVREQLKTVKGLDPKFHDRIEYLDNLDIDEPTETKIREIMNNSFLDADDNWITPPLFSETYEMDAFQHFMDTVVTSSHQAGGANTYIKNKLTQNSSKKTHRRLKSRTASAARRRNNRRRRTARK